MPLPNNNPPIRNVFPGFNLVEPTISKSEMVALTEAITRLADLIESEHIRRTYEALGFPEKPIPFPHKRLVL